MTVQGSWWSLMSSLQVFMVILPHCNRDVHLGMLQEEGLPFKIHKMVILLSKRTRVVRARSSGNTSLTKPLGAHSGSMKVAQEINLKQEPLYLLQVKMELKPSVEVTSSTSLQWNRAWASTATKRQAQLLAKQWATAWTAQTEDQASRTCTSVWENTRGATERRVCRKRSSNKRMGLKKKAWEVHRNCNRKLRLLSDKA